LRHPSLQENPGFGRAAARPPNRKSKTRREARFLFGPTRFMKNVIPKKGNLYSPVFIDEYSSLFLLREYPIRVCLDSTSRILRMLFGLCHEKTHYALMVGDTY
jgi:hypothetical protein